MRRILLAMALIVTTVGLSGCGNLSPRLDEKIDNQNGKIDEIRNNQNGLMLELGKLKQSAEIQNSQLKEVQQGMLNVNAAVSKNENSGVQILQGDGALILVFSLGVIGMLLYYYRDRAIQSEQTAEILAREVARYNSPILNDGILRAAMHTESEQQVFHLLTKHQQEIEIELPDEE